MEQLQSRDLTVSNGIRYSLLDEMLERGDIKPAMRRAAHFYRSLNRRAMGLMGAPSLKKASFIRVDQPPCHAIEPFDHEDAVWILHCWRCLCLMISPADRVLVGRYVEAPLNTFVPTTQDKRRIIPLLIQLQQFYSQVRKIKKNAMR